MRLTSDQQVRNTRMKLEGIEKLIADKIASPDRGPAYEACLHTLRRWADKLRKEIEEYQNQTAARA